MIQKIFKSNLLKSAGTYTLFNVLDKAIPFLIIPIITRIISVEDVGYYTLYQAIFNILVPLITLSIGSSILLNFYKLEFEQFKIYFSNGIIFFIIVSMFTLSIVFLSAEKLSSLLDFPVFWLKIAFVIVIFEFFNSLRKYLWQAKKQAVKYGLFSISLTLSKNVLGMVLIVFYDYSWQGIIIGYFIAELVFSLFSIFSFYRERLFLFEINVQYIKDIVKVGGPLSLHSVGAWLSNSVNRIIISSILGKIAVGSYGVGATFGIILTVVHVSFNNAFVPYLFDKLKNPTDDVKASLVKVTYLYYISIMILGILFSVSGYFFVGFIFGDEYFDTRNFIIPLVLAASFNGMYKMHVNYIFFLKRTFVITKITFLSGLLNIFLSYVMVLNIGLLGAAYSALFIQMITYCVTFYYSNKLFPLPWFNFKHRLA